MIRHLVKAYFYSILIVLILWNIDELQSGGHQWVTGDWLINYSGGLVKRGLFGELAMFMANIGIPLAAPIFIIQSVAYAYIFTSVQEIYFSFDRDKSWLIFLFSPIFVVSPFFDPGLGFRKEIIVFCLFLFVSKRLLIGTLKNVEMIACVFCYGFAILMHEIACFALPFFLYLFGLLETRGVAQKKAILSMKLAFGILAISGAVFSFFFSGSAATSDAICRSILEKGFQSGLCGGAIKWLGYPANYGLEIVTNNIATYASFYFPIFILAMLPIFLTNWMNESRWRLTIAGFFTILPLFFLAIDWGRWIWFFSFFLYVLVLIESKFTRINIAYIHPFAVIFYLISWNAPGYYRSHEGLGYFGVTWDLVKDYKREGNS